MLPYKSIREQSWPCHKVGQGQPMIIIWKHFEGLPESSMLYTMSEGHAFFFNNLGQIAQKQICSRAGNSKVNFMSVLVTCKFDDDSIKIKVVIVSSNFLHFLYFYGEKKFMLKGMQLTLIVCSGLKWNLSKNLCFALVICKFEEDPIKTEGSIVSTTFFFCAQGNSEVNGQVWTEFQPVQNFTVVLFSCKFDDDTIKIKGAIVFTTFSPL